MYCERLVLATVLLEYRYWLWKQTSSKQRRMVVWFSKSLCGVSCAPWKMEMMISGLIRTEWQTNFDCGGYEKVMRKYSWFNFCRGWIGFIDFFGDRYSMPPTTTTRTCFNWCAVWVDRSTAYTRNTSLPPLWLPPGALKVKKASQTNVFIDHSSDKTFVCIQSTPPTNHPRHFHP